MSVIRPQFSIIIPSYNRGYCIGAAIASVQAQIEAGWELIVVDDGSTDGTKETVERFCKNDKRIRYVHKDNGGAASARNRGWQEAVGEIIFYLILQKHLPTDQSGLWNGPQKSALGSALYPLALLDN